MVLDIFKRAFYSLLGDPEQDLTRLKVKRQGGKAPKRASKEVMNKLNTCMIKLERKKNRKWLDVGC